MITVAILDKNGGKHSMDLPSRERVCLRCKGHGTILYSRHGGQYFDSCPTCWGAKVVDAVNLDACNEAQRNHYNEFLVQEREKRDEREDEEWLIWRMRNGHLLS